LPDLGGPYRFPRHDSPGELDAGDHLVQRVDPRHDGRYPPRMIGSDKAAACEALCLQLSDHRQQAGEPLLLFCYRTKFPGKGNLRHEPAGEARQGSRLLVLEVELGGMPPFVRGLEAAQADVLVVAPGAATMQVDAGAAYGGVHTHALDLCLDGGHREEISPQTRRREECRGSPHRGR